MAKARTADEILRFAEFWKGEPAQVPQELVFDSQLTTYANLRRLDEKEIRFLTLRRRTRKMLAEIFSPSSAWRRVTLRSLTRTYRTPGSWMRGSTSRATARTIRQLSVIDLGHEEPTILLTNDFTSTPVQLITRYAQRMLIENGIAEAIHFFHIDALSSMVDLKVDFDLQITLWWKRALPPARPHRPAGTAAPRPRRSSATCSTSAATSRSSADRSS